MVTVSPPVEGPRLPWATPNDVSSCGIDIRALNDDILALNLTIASEILYRKFGYQFPGQASETIRPITRSDLCGQCSDWGGGYIPGIIEGVWYNFGPGCISGAGSSPSLGVVYEGGIAIPRIDLGQYPVTAITSVKIDGATFAYDSGANYRLDDWRYLVRTDGNLWPSAQNLLLDDTQPGTWSVQLIYGAVPPQTAISACAQLASELTKHCMGEMAKCQLPLRVTAMTRQGVTYSLPDVMDILNRGKTGLYFVDLAIDTFNPHGLDRPARVVSPDLPPYRRVGSV